MSFRASDSSGSEGGGSLTSAAVELVSSSPVSALYAANPKPP